MHMCLYHPRALVVASAFLFSVACGTASQSQTTSGSQSDESVVARIGDHDITMSELDDKVLASNMKVFQELYNARREALSELVADALLSREATDRGISKDELIAVEITANVIPVTDADIEGFYNQNQARLGGQSLEQIAGQIREFMVARNEAMVMQGYIDGLREKANVEIVLDPPRVPMVVADNERVLGAPDAEVTIVEYSDFQ